MSSRRPITEERSLACLLLYSAFENHYISHMIWKSKKDKKTPIVQTKKALIDVDGATCTSCVYTIEHVGAKINGVVDCYVDRNTSQIQLEYDGRDETIDEIVKLVDKIGYSAVLNSKDVDNFGG